jgi:hypothetical protein
MPLVHKFEQKSINSCRQHKYIEFNRHTKSCLIWHFFIESTQIQLESNATYVDFWIMQEKKWEMDWLGTTATSMYSSYTFTFISIFWQLHLIQGMWLSSKLFQARSIYSSVKLFFLSNGGFLLVCVHSIF